MNKESIAKLLMKETVAFVTETGDEVIYGSEYHINELDELVNRLQRIKKSLKKGGDRHKNRKEIHRILGAVESIRFLKRKAERAGVKKGLISESSIVKYEILTKKDISDAVEIYSCLIDRWGERLKEEGHRAAIPISMIDTKYDTKSDGIFLVGILSDRESTLEEIDKAKYKNLFLEFIESESFSNIDTEKTLCLEETMSTVIRLPNKKLVHIDGVASFIKKGDRK